MQWKRSQLFMSVLLLIFLSKEIIVRFNDIFILFCIEPFCSHTALSFEVLIYQAVLEYVVCSFKAGIFARKAVSFVNHHLYRF